MKTPQPHAEHTATLYSARTTGVQQVTDAFLCSFGAACAAFGSLFPSGSFQRSVALGNVKPCRSFRGAVRSGGLGVQAAEEGEALAVGRLL